MNRDTFEREFIRRNICVRVIYNDWSEIYYYSDYNIREIVDGEIRDSTYDVMDMFIDMQLNKYEILPYDVIFERSYHENQRV